MLWAGGCSAGRHIALLGRAEGGEMSELDTFLRGADVTRVTGVKRAMRYVLIARGEFPKPIKLSERMVVWSARDLADWQDEQKRKNGYVG
jgi:prophage regulatory protein